MADYTFDQNLFTPSGVGVTVDVPDPVQSTVTLNPVESTVTLKPTQSTVTLTPIQTTSAVKLDVEPVVTDLCHRVTFGPVPHTHIRQPYRHRVSLSWFGVEIFGLDYCGEAFTSVESAPSRPHVVGGEGERHESAHAGKHAPSGGLRIRVEGD